MPHCIIEHSASTADITTDAALVSTVHQAAIDALLFDPGHIKTRSIAYPTFQLGDNHSHFIHVTVRLHRGRTEEQKKRLTNLIVERLCTSLPLADITITAETVEIDTPAYAKATLV